jgi:crossover junction endodeoxyribonuclease RusA
MNRYQRASIVRDMRDHAGWLIRAAKIPHLERGSATLLVYVRDQRRRDPVNYTPTVKAAVDAAVDVGVFDDDHYGIVSGQDVRIEYRPGAVGCYLEIREEL